MSLSLSDRRQPAAADGEADRLSVAVFAGGAGRWDWDVRSDVVVWDRAEAVLFGHERSAASGACAEWLARVHPDDRLALTTTLRRCAEQRLEFDHTCRVLGQDGSVRSVLSRGRRLSRSGDEDRMTGLSLDVTASRREAAGAQHLLQVSTALAAAVLPDEVAWAVLSLGLAPIGLQEGEIVTVSASGLLQVTGSDDPTGTASELVRDASLVRAVARSGVPVLPWLLPPSPRGEDGPYTSSPVCVPLQAAGRTIGVLSARLRPGWTPTTADQHALLLLAGLCAQALDRALLHQQAADVAQTLQRHLLPARLPEVAGVELAGRYLAGTLGLSVGGDWFDAMASPGRVALVLGDVVGKGLAASALMSWARHTVNAYAQLDPSPAVVLRHTDRHAESELDECQIVTVICAVLEDDGTLRHASAGHPPPLIIGPGATAEYLVVDPQPPLGAGWGERTQQVAVLPAGAVLLMYSDGLIERRGQDLQDGMEALRLAAAESYRGSEMPLGELCDGLVDRLLRGTRLDDVTLLAVRRRGDLTERPSAVPEVHPAPR